MAGFLGIGGGVIIIPLLLYGAGLSIKLAAGISMVQAFFATLSGLLIHRRNHTLDLRLGAVLGSAGVVGAFLGSVGSAELSARALLYIYFLLLLASLTLLFFAPRTDRAKPSNANLALAVPIGLGVGTLAGMLGVGGGFVLIPLMIAVMRVPTRIAVGTSLVVILTTTLAGSTGKIATGQFDASIAFFVILGSIVGAQVGGRVNSRVSPRGLRLCLTLLLSTITVRTAIDLLTLP